MGPPVQGARGDGLLDCEEEELCTDPIDVVDFQNSLQAKWGLAVSIEDEQVGSPFHASGTQPAVTGRYRIETDEQTTAAELRQTLLAGMLPLGADDVWGYDDLTNATHVVDSHYDLAPVACTVIHGPHDDDAPEWPITANVEVFAEDGPTPRSREDGFDFDVHSGNLQFFGGAGLEEGDETTTHEHAVVFRHRFHYRGPGMYPDPLCNERRN